MKRPSSGPVPGSWALSGFTPGAGLRAGAHLPDREPPDAIPARVPGTVQSALARAGLVPDPYADGNARFLESSARMEWWYRVRFAYPLAPGRRLWLRFHGVDYDAEFWLNGERLGGHVGMFSPVVFDTTPHLRRENLLAVRLAPPPAKRRRALKAQFGYGWDFAPRIATSGLWDEVELFETGAAMVSDVFARSPRKSKEKLELRLDVHVKAPHRCRQYQASLGGREAAIEAHHGRHDLYLPAEELATWAPWDRGEPVLHILRVAVDDSDAVEFPIGLRTVERLPLRPENPKKDLWLFRVNGRREFLRGANWVPPDSLLRLDDRRYEELLRAAREANINFLRVWGGGLRERRAFYDLCDRLGILVWQDLPFACKTYPQTRAFCDLARQEASAIVRDLRNHPSLFLWCGGNEYSAWRNARLFRALEETVRSLDPTRPFHPSSPRHGDVHDWTVWHSFAPLKAYERSRAPFVSEFGLQACPSAVTMRRMLPNPWPPGPEWRFRKASMLKLKRYARIFSKQKFALEEFVDASQRAQAAALKTAIEHHRRRKDSPDAPCGGFALWMWNEPWPCVSWSVVEHSGARKRACGAVRESCRPLLPSLEWQFRRGALEATAWVVNDSMEPFSGAMEAEGPGGLRWETPVEAAADSSARAGSFRWALAPGAEITARLRKADGTVVAENHYETFKEPVEWFPHRLATAIPQAFFT